MPGNLGPLCSQGWDFKKQQCEGSGAWKAEDEMLLMSSFRLNRAYNSHIETLDLISFYSLKELTRKVTLRLIPSETYPGKYLDSHQFPSERFSELLFTPRQLKLYCLNSMLHNNLKFSLVVSQNW